MKYLVFSDIHGNAFAFREFLNDIKKLQFDRVICLGDFVGYYYDSDEIIRYCKDNQIECVLGNHDDYFLKMLDGELKQEFLVSRYGHSYSRAKEAVSKQSIEFLRSLQPSLTLSDESGDKLFFCHGSPVDLINGRVYPDTDLAQFEPLVAEYSYVVFGNTHHKMVRKYKDTLYLNPGSLGQQRDGRGCSYMLIDTKNGVDFKIVSYDIGALESQIDKYDSGNERLKSVLRRPATTP